MPHIFLYALPDALHTGHTPALHPLRPLSPLLVKLQRFPTLHLLPYLKPVTSVHKTLAYGPRSSLLLNSREVKKAQGMILVR